jgi:hypothetical protein
MARSKFFIENEMFRRVDLHHRNIFWPDLANIFEKQLEKIFLPIFSTTEQE